MAKPGNKNAVGNKGGTGRPTLYRPEYAEMARNICLMRSAATDEDLARIFEVGVDTIDLWKRKHPDFYKGMIEGKEIADAKVARAMYERATGYSHEAVKIFYDKESGGPVIVPYTEHYPPDTPAAKMWLTNRQPKLWRDRVEVGSDPSAPVRFIIEGAPPNKS